MISAVEPDAWIAVSRNALKHNFHALRDFLAQREGAAPQMICVVKANAFGHGSEAARVLEDAGASFFAVTTPDEAFELRAQGVQSRLLVFLPPLPGQVAGLVSAGFDLTVSDGTLLAPLSGAAQAQGLTVSVHLKVDTGMGRLGVLPGDALALARQIVALPGLHLAGVYTHFANALEKDAAASRRQFAVFEQVLSDLENAGIDPGLRHCANSAALVRFPEMQLDAIRPGTILYGQYPSASVPRALALRETWRMQARIVSVRDVPPGTPVGYGGEWRARRPSRLAVLPVGYADGFTVAPASVSRGWRGLKQWLRPAPVTVTVRGRQVPVVGRVAMQICTVDVTDVPGAAAGDLVTVPARRILASARLPRVYRDDFV